MISCLIYCCFQKICPVKSTYCALMSLLLQCFRNIAFYIASITSSNYILYHCTISSCNVGVLLAALCNLFPFPVCWPGQVWWLAGASRARWASCWPGALQRLTTLTRYQMAVEHQQAGKYTDTHTHTHTHTVTHASVSHMLYISVHTQRHSAVHHKKQSIRKRCSPPVSLEVKCLMCFYCTCLPAVEAEVMHNIVIYNSLHLRAHINVTQKV